MKKFTILMALIAMVSFAMAQQNVKYSVKDDQSKVSKSDFNYGQKDEAVWECTFDEATPLYTLVNPTGVKTWTVSDTTPSWGFTSASYGGEVPPSWIYMGWRYVHDYSTSGHNFAWIDGISALLGLGDYGMEVSESTVRFDNIDLSASNNPKLTFYQNYKVFNSDECYIDFSTDGGTTWESLRINEKVSLGGVNKYGPTYLEFVVTDYVANAANVSIRFRWLCTDVDASYGSGYGWQIDDIAIVETPTIDLNLKQCNMSYFSYGDYTDPAYAAYNVYQISGYYGHLPQAQLASQYANAWFNVIVENKGVNTVIPQAKVQVFDPEMTSLFEYIVEGTSIITNAIDTVDLVETEFPFDENMALGKYTVVYNVYVIGEDDANVLNNSDTSYFYITENVLSRDVELPNNRESLNNSSLGNVDTEKFGQTYDFLVDSQITSVDVFIDENTSAGTNVILHAYVYNSTDQKYDEVMSSALIDITEASLGHWINITFSDPFQITVDPAVGSYELLIALEMYYNVVGNEIWIGYDKYPYVEGPHNHAFYTQYTSEPDTWYYGGLDGGLSMRVNFNDYTINDKAPMYVMNNVNIYPNPTMGTLNIENVEGSQVMIINMMGQVVETIENANMVNTLDMSKYANGTYFVKVINGNAVSTHKVNLMK